MEDYLLRCPKWIETSSKEHVLDIALFLDPTGVLLGSKKNTNTKTENLDKTPHVLDTTYSGPVLLHLVRMVNPAREKLDPKRLGEAQLLTALPNLNQPYLTISQSLNTKFYRCILFVQF